MKVLVDTAVWSLAFRRRRVDLSDAERSLVDELGRLVRTGDAILLGVVRQEVLSGIRYPDKFEALRRDLRAIDDVPLDAADYEQAAEAFNECRKHGTSASGTDMLICAVSARRKWLIFSTDSDFQRYAKWLPIRLHQVTRAGG